MTVRAIPLAITSPTQDVSSPRARSAAVKVRNDTAANPSRRK
jgi:hypothetical protein